MFSGIIEDIGTIEAIQPRGGGRTLTVRTGLAVAPPGQAGVGTADRERLGLGDSVAVMGACLTVESVTAPDRFDVAAGRETLDRTTIGALKRGGRVHLERALRLGDRLDGHMVSGHVDGVGAVSRIERQAESVVLWVEASADLARYVAEKGSIAIDGVSLTVNEVADRAGAVRLRVNIVPFTADHTLLGALRVGDRVNIEVDVVSRYLERLLGAGGRMGGLTAERMADLGYGSNLSRSRGG